MVSNGTPSEWSARAKAQAPRSIIVVGKAEDRPATRPDPDPLYVGEDEDFDTRDDFLTLLLVGAILGILVALTLWAPDIFRLMREWVLG